MMASSKFVTLERRPDGVALVSINNAPVNALTTPVFAELLAIAKDLQANPPGAVVLAGQPKIFALGGEISEMRRIRFNEQATFGDADLDAAVSAITDPVYVRELGKKYLATFDALAKIPRMVIAAIQGIALGGGLEMALACDYRIASDRAKMGSPEVTLGGGTIGGGVFRMTRLIGPSLTKKMYLGGMTITAQEALRIGLVDEVVPVDEALDRALALAKTFVPYACPAQGGLKEIIDLGSFGLSEAEAGELELKAWCDSYATDESRRRLREFFAQGAV